MSYKILNRIIVEVLCRFGKVNSLSEVVNSKILVNVDMGFILCSLVKFDRWVFVGLVVIVFVYVIREVICYVKVIVECREVLYLGWC